MRSWLRQMICIGGVAAATWSASGPTLGIAAARQERSAGAPAVRGGAGDGPAQADEPRPATRPAPQAASFPVHARSLLGKTRPDFVGRDVMSGQAILSQHLGAKLILIDFWSTQSEACKANLPVLRQAFEAHHQEGFDIISVCLDEDIEKARQFIRDEKMIWLNIVEGRGPRSAVAAAFGVASVPMMYLIDHAGVVVWEGDSARHLLEAVDVQMKLLPQEVELPATPDYAHELDAARKLYTDKKYFDALRAFEQIARKYPGTQGARYAQAQAEEIKSDARIAPELARQKAAAEEEQRKAAPRGMLTLADMMVSSEKYDTARKIYERIIQDYPDSEEARTARQKLETLPK